MFQSKFTTPLAIAALGCLIGFGAAAHEFVASSKTTPTNGKDTAAFILDSTHVFGTPEEAEAPKHVLAQLITPSATTELDVTENADAPNLTGTFTLSKEEPAWLVGHRLPVIWSQTPDGWKEGGPDAHPDAVASSRFEKFSKNLTGGSQNADFISSPLGHKLEIVPLSESDNGLPHDPFQLKTGLLQDSAAPQVRPESRSKNPVQAQFSEPECH